MEYIHVWRFVQVRGGAPLHRGGGNTRFPRTHCRRGCRKPCTGRMTASADRPAFDWGLHQMVANMLSVQGACLRASPTLQRNSHTSRAHSRNYTGRPCSIIAIRFPESIQNGEQNGGKKVPACLPRSAPVSRHSAAEARTHAKGSRNQAATQRRAGPRPGGAELRARHAWLAAEPASACQAARACSGWINRSHGEK